MIHHDYIHAHGVRRCQRFVRHGSAIHRHDQAGAFTGQPHQRFAGWPIAFKQPIRNVVPGLYAKIAQKQDQQRRAGCAINVIIAVNRDLFVRKDCIGQPACSAVHIAED